MTKHWDLSLVLSVCSSKFRFVLFGCVQQTPYGHSDPVLNMARPRRTWTLCVKQRRKCQTDWNSKVLKYGAG